MVKKKYSWGKGYNHRKQHEVRHQEAEYYGRKQGRPMATTYSKEEIAQEVEEASLLQEVHRYRKAWEAEKAINKASAKDWEAILAHQAQQRKLAAFKGLAIGLSLGGLVVSIIWALSL